VKAVREAIGPDVDLIIENHSFTDAQSSAQLGKMMKKYGIFYFEEPTTPTPQLSKFVHDETGLPIANGERIYTRWQYIEYFKENAIQVIQPDVGTCGGITEIKKICDMAYTFDVGVQVHACGSPLSTAAALHLECAIPNFVIHEHHTYARTKYNRELCIYDYQPVNGKFEVPDLPGLGQELSEVAFKNCDMVTIQ
jgi:L-alanine-DL-glutamate epimerase-like enolase superfamily enzyme